ncbi:SapC family protein [Cellvibrio zantedeschiae]|uniref:SapC family protein n=1 Tax=Cellvibrio zantedeschiae TaxID=1237077 RepID=A0ABQ3B316_9GAMM|nr:SapC family protein [Cellvibrio zantedeschiae]GGY76992.1 SapC family protein [Cellvibrio zantedeschiae]
MANNVLLNNVAHQNLKVIGRFGPEFGNNVSSVLVFPAEFIELQKEYTILFRRNLETQKYHTTVLLGLSQNENLFLNPNLGSGWAANYIPASVVKGPFLIGFQSQNSGNSKTPVIHIDLDHPKVSQEDGYPLFLEHGGNSPYLEHIAKNLNVIHEGMAQQDAMFDMFSEFDLLEPIDIDVDLNNNERIKLVGNYTINEDKLTALSGEQLEKLNKKGFLPLAYAVITSLTNIRKLTEIKNNKK